MASSSLGSELVGRTPTSTGATPTERAMDIPFPPHVDHGSRPRHGSFDSQVPQIRLNQFSFPLHAASDATEADNAHMYPRPLRSSATLPTHVRHSRSEDLYYPAIHHGGDFTFPEMQFLSLHPPPSPQFYPAPAPMSSEASGSDYQASDAHWSPYTSPSVSPQTLATELPVDSASGSASAVLRPTITSARTRAAAENRRKERPRHACPVPGCGSTFTRRVNLAGHVRSHNDERPFACGWAGCERAFARQHDCRRHEQRHARDLEREREREFACAGCGWGFSSVEALSRHLNDGVECQRIVDAGRQQQQQQQLTQFPTQPESAAIGDGDWLHDGMLFMGAETTTTTTTAVADFYQWWEHDPLEARPHRD